MSTNEWITDRFPTKEDADYNGYVWNSFGCLCCWDLVQIGDAWMKTNRPAPYVKPKSWTVTYNESICCWMLYGPNLRQAILADFYLNNDEHREAAERIAAIYEEVVP